MTYIYGQKIRSEVCVRPRLYFFSGGGRPHNRLPGNTNNKISNDVILPFKTPNSNTRYHTAGEIWSRLTVIWQLFQSSHAFPPDCLIYVVGNWGVNVVIGRKHVLSSPTFHLRWTLCLSFQRWTTYCPPSILQNRDHFQISDPVLGRAMQSPGY